MGILLFLSPETLFQYPVQKRHPHMSNLTGRREEVGVQSVCNHLSSTKVVSARQPLRAYRKISPSSDMWLSSFSVVILVLCGTSRSYLVLFRFARSLIQRSPT